MSRDDRAKDTVNSLVRGLSVLLAFGKHRDAMSISEASAATALSPATARRILLTLRELGYVKQKGRRFSITPRVLDLGYAYLTSMTLWQITQPVLERISAEFRVSSSAAVLDEMDILYVVRAAAHTVRGGLVSTGTRQPAHVTAMGRVLLAGLNDDILEQFMDRIDFKPYTPYSITTIAALRDALARVREQNYALVDQELDFGLRAIAVPIRNRAGELLAAINAAGHKRSIELEYLRDKVLPTMFEAADEIRTTLGA
jgi:IclR family pca regulon transcriptional regulator